MGKKTVSFVPSVLEETSIYVKGPRGHPFTAFPAKIEESNLLEQH